MDASVSPLEPKACAELEAYRPVRAWTTVIILMILQTISLVDRNVLSLMVIEVRKDLGLNDFQISLLQGLAFSAFYCVAGIFIAGLVDRYPAKRLLLYISVSIWSLAATAVGLVRTFWGIMAARMMTGAGEGGVSPAAQSLIASLFPRNRVSLPMSLFVISGALGIGLSYFGGGLLLEAVTARSIPGLEAYAPWRQVVMITALPGLLIAFLSFALYVPKASKQASVTMSWGEFGSFLLAERNLVGRLVIGYGLITIANFAMSSWAPTYARRVLLLTTSQVGVEMGLVSSVGGIITAALYGAVVDRQFSRGRTDFVLKAYGLGMVVAIPLCAIGFILNSNATFVAALVVAQCALIAPLGPGIAAIQMVTPPAMRGRMAALVIFVVNLAGYGGGSILVGALTEFFFVDPQKVGLSIALTLVVVAPFSALLIWSARPYFVARVTGGVA